MEKQLQADIKEYLNKIGAFYIVPNNFGVRSRKPDPSMKGCSDIIVCYKGKFIALEVKASKKDLPRGDQTYFLKKIQDAQGLTFVISSIDEVIYIFNNLAVERSAYSRPLLLNSTRPH